MPIEDLTEDGKLEVHGTVDMTGCEDMSIKFAKNSGKYFIDIHPID